MPRRSVTLATIESRIPRCARCPELREYCAQVGREKRKAFADSDYWAKPVPGFGDHGARIAIVGLAPAAHGANRTGRMFTGDRSGDFLYAALHRAGLANQPYSTSRDDGLELRDVYIAASLRCAPPANRPTPRQLDNCRVHLRDELAALRPHVVLCLGSIGWRSAMLALESLGERIPRPRPKFGHGGICSIGACTVIGSYHVSQQNTFTGRLTESMFDAVIEQAKAAAGHGRG